MRHAYITKNRGFSKLSIRVMCRLLELDKSGCYKWRRRCLSLARRREVLEVQIKEIFEEEHRIPDTVKSIGFSVAAVLNAV